MREERAEVQKRRSTDDLPAEKRVCHEAVPLSSLVGSPEALAQAAVDALSWDLVVGMLPDYLKSQPKERITQLVKTELEGMSRGRISSILGGHEISSSSSSESSVEDEDSENDRSEAEEELDHDSRSENGLGGDKMSSNGDGASSSRSRTDSSPGRSDSPQQNHQNSGEDSFIELYE